MSTALTIQKPSELMTFLQEKKGSIAMALPKHLNPDRMLRLAVTAFSGSAKLRECTPASILSSIIVASQLGLEIGIAGQAYLVPYGKTCTLVPGWQGLVGLLNNSGRATAWSAAVFEGDEFDYSLGSSPHIVHRPGMNAGDPAKMTHVYACGKVNGSEQPVMEVWTMARVWAHRDKFNKVGKEHYSYQHPEMYGRKVVLLQVLKYMPRSIELNNAVAAANFAEMGNSSRVEEGTIIEVQAETTPQIEEGKVGKSPVVKKQPAPAETTAATTAPAETTTAEQKAPPAEEKSAATAAQTGPDPEPLRKKLFALGVAAQLGRSVLADRLAELKYIGDGVKITELSASHLAELIDCWPEILDKITNPGGEQ